MIAKTTYIYTVKVGDKWFQEYYADDKAMMELFQFHQDHYRAVPDSTLTFSEKIEGDYRIGTVVYEKPMDNLVDESDPRLQQFFQLVYDYYSQPGRSFEIVTD